MATTIITKHSATAKDPQPNQLERGELAIDLARKNIYTKDFSDEVVQLGGSSVKIGSAAPPTPQEGDLWMEVPTTVDEPAMMWVYDGDKWLEHPSGVDGAPGADGADGNIADATEQGVVATWDDSAKQWTPDSSLAIDSSGNVGIGTGAPAAQFEVKGSNTNARFRGVGSQMINVNFSETPSSAEIDFRNAGNFHISKQGSPALTIDSSGDATFSGKVVTNNVGSESNSCGIRFSAASEGGASTRVLPTDTSSVKDGEVDIGSASGRFKDAYFSGTVDAAGFTVNGVPIGGGGLPDGGYTYGWNITAADFIATSDERVKDNITTAPVGLIDSLKGREWDWAESGEKGSGVVAQELEQVLPHLVHEDDDGMKSVSYNGLVAYLIEEVKALRAEVEELK